MADYLHDNYGALAGNFCFGLLLGMTGYLGYLTGLPLDIRHVAFASANLGYSCVSADFTPLQFAGQFLLVLLIGFVNLWVSFTLALTVALHARGTSISKLPTLLASVWEKAGLSPIGTRCCNLRRLSAGLNQAESSQHATVNPPVNTLAT